MPRLMVNDEQAKVRVGGQRAFDIVRDRIRADLAEGILKPGDKLPAEREFAEKLGFSRAAVREALRGLEATGVVQLQKGVAGGAFIQGGDKKGVSRSISDLIILGGVPLRQIMEVRSLLLTHAVRLACEKAESFDALDLNISNTEAQADDYEATFHNINEFYSVIGKLSGNDVLTMLIDSVTNLTTVQAKELQLEFTDEILVLRRALLARLKARDQDGAALAVAKTMAFLHGFIMARAADR